MFGAICAGRPVQTNIQSISATQFVFHLPSPKTINHLVIFLLPDTILPPTHAATIHVRFPGQQAFHLLGAINASKPSAIFRVRGLAGFASDDDGMSDAGAGNGVEDEVILGISVEPVEMVEQQLQQLPNHGVAGSGVGVGMAENGGNSGMELVKAQPPKTQTQTVVLARRIIKDAFNFLSSFAAAPIGGGDEVVPLKAFQEWWNKFEKKVVYDPSFLEREDV